MTKKEIIWREILERVLQKKQRQFQQQELAHDLDMSLSTIFNALQVPRRTGAVKVSRRGFQVLDPFKLNLIWATERNLDKDIIYQTRVDKPILEIEAQLPPAVTLAGYTAYRQIFQETPADYDKIYVYATDPQKIKERFPPQKGYSNLIVLKADSFLEKAGPLIPQSQLFADLWNLKEWYAKEFYLVLEKKLKEKYA